MQWIKCIVVQFAEQMQDIKTLVKYGSETNIHKLQTLSQISCQQQRRQGSPQESAPDVAGIEEG